MLDQYNYHKDYLSACVIYIFNVIMYFPMLNNYYCLSCVIDYYIRCFVYYNHHCSSQICDDCSCFVNFSFTDEYIESIKETFDNDEDAFHYLAILLQTYRFSNLYKLRSSNTNETWDYNRLANAVMKNGK